MLRCRYRISKPWGARRPVLKITIDYDPILDPIYDRTSMIIQPAFVSAYHTLLPNIKEYLESDPIKSGSFYLEHKPLERKFEGEAILPIRPREETLAIARHLAWFVLHRVVTVIAHYTRRKVGESQVYL